MTAAPLAGPPERDLVDLAQRFRGLPDDTPRLARETPFDYAVGDKEDFSLINLDEPEAVSITASVRLITDHAYFFVQNGTPVSDSNLSRIGEEFESIVYPTVTAVFGREWTPGVDSDPRITILHADLRGAAGYVSGSDEFPAAVAPRSNEREMLYIYGDALGSPGVGYNALVAHELQHLIHQNVDDGEESWVNEGLSEVSAGLIGGGLDTAELFLAFPDTQLNHWPAIEDSSVHYAASELFFTYLLERFGGRENASKLAAQPLDGIAGVEEYLKPFGVTFRDVFADWILANYLDREDGPYGHKDLDQKVTVTTTIRALGGADAEVHQFGTDYLQVDPPGGSALFNFNGSKEVSIGVPPADGAFWWSGRGDGIDSRLTRELDLTEVDTATLRFSTWFDIEEGWDYAYVAVSADDGETWQALPGRHTTTYDPVGAAYGPGYTGKSEGWLEEEVDLTAFTGQKVLLRFEYVTDDAANLTGFAVDNVEVAEAGFGDSADDVNGWIAEGYEMIKGPLPQAFVIQVIEESGEIRRVPLDGTKNDAAIAVDRPVTIVIAAVTDGTAEPGAYTWSLAAE